MWRLLILIFLVLFLLLLYSMGIVEARFIKAFKCGDYEIVLQTDNGTRCSPCPGCPPGWEPETPCRSTLQVEGNDIKLKMGCRHCPQGTYSLEYSKFGHCQQCSKCTPSEHEIHKCTPESDTRCLWCPEGYYFNNDTLSCLPCSHCCGDSHDVLIPACLKKGTHGSCSFASYQRCHGAVRNETISSSFNVHINCTKNASATSNTFTTPVSHYMERETNNQNNHRQSFKNVILFVMVGTIVIIVLLFPLVWVVLRKKGKTTKRTILCIPKFVSNKHISLTDVSKSIQSDDVDDWAQRDSTSGTYSFNSDITIWYNKKSQFYDGTKNIVVEVANSQQSYGIILDPDQKFLSPVFKFYSQGTQFENPVLISLPHSALVGALNNWTIKVLVCDAREQKKLLKWKEVEGEIEINWNHVTFSTSTLLTYVVVGKPVQSAKKRMQLVLYSMQEMISDQLEMVLYLVDESVSSLQRISKENKAKDWKMISTKYVAFVECFSPVNISVTVDGLEEPWTLLHVKPEVMSNKVLVDSYSDIPSFHVTFRRLNRSAQIFSCDFHVDIGGEKKIIIPAATFLPEELPFFNCETRNEDPTVFDKKFLLRDLSYDIKYQLCRKLDIPAKDRGQWRDVGRHFLISEETLVECSLAYATLDGSPSRRLLDFIQTTRPNLTVGEFAKVLEDLDRSDVVAVLSKAKMTDVAIG